MTAFFHKYNMQLKELDSFKMSDALYFHKDLNPAIFDGDRMNEDVRQQLLAIAEDFIEHLGISDLDVKDITISGSNAAYSYTRHSDIDLHIVVEMKQFQDDDVYRELFDAKKIVYNQQHDIYIHDYEVELYVQDADQPHISLGEYSVMFDKWNRLPRKRKANFDQMSTKLKYEKLAKLAEFAYKSNNLEKLESVWKTIKKYRQAGLDLNGEFGPENLAFKALRNNKIIEKLKNKIDELHSQRLSLPESKVTHKSAHNSKLAKIHNQLKKEFAQYTDEDYDPNSTPPGPEFKPTMPAGTVKVDVSDVYDWYKLGQHISNLKGLGQHDFGQGPPSTIMAFGSEPEEHEYIKDLEKTGLTTTDIDPLDPNQPKSLPLQKVDPTYNVNEKINPEVTKKDFHAEKDIDIEGVGPLKLVAKNLYTNYPSQFKVDVLTPEGQSIGYFRFVVIDYDAEENPRFNIFSKFKEKKDPYVIGGNVSVWREYQKKGIARAVYQWVKSMGNDIKPSPTQTDAGKAMWQGFAKNQLMDVNEASGYIPSEKEKNDPRWKSALSVDVGPDAIKKNTKAFGFKVSRAGIPPLLRK